jgi:hypothetical protein
MQGRSRDPKPFKIAILWRGDAEARHAATPQNNRFYRIFEELAAVGIHAEPAVYDEGVREQLLAADGVLVWVDPVHQGTGADANISNISPWTGVVHQGNATCLVERTGCWVSSGRCRQRWCC